MSAPETAGGRGLSAASRTMAADDPRHGRDAGYSKHRRDGERPCDPCMKAHYAAQLEREAAEPIALTDGSWVPNGRSTLVWQPDANAPILPPEQRQELMLRRAQFADLDVA